MHNQDTSAANGSGRTSPDPVRAASSPTPELRFLLPESRPQYKTLFGGAGLTYAAGAIVVVLLMWLQPPLPSFTPELPPLDPTDIVFLDIPGPGGGGGGGGNRSEAPPATEPKPAIKPVEEKPLPVAIPDPPPPPPQIQETPVAAEVPALPIDAPPAVVAAAPPSPSPSLGSGTGTGAGTGAGSGIGSGTGSGLGPGAGGGTGGGVYQVGSGVTSPVALNRPKPLYTPEAMLRRIQGEVMLSCVVLATGDMGKCDVVKPLDNNTYGLDNEALKAASKFRFKPGTRQGEPVAVQVNIILEFNMR